MACSNEGALSVNADAGVNIINVAPANALMKTLFDSLDFIAQNSIKLVAKHTSNLDCERVARELAASPTSLLERGDICREIFGRVAA
jgi:hypothetical protein